MVGSPRKWSIRKLSPTTWFFVACSCCTGVLYERKAHKRRKLARSAGSGFSTTASTLDLESPAAAFDEFGVLGSGDSFTGKNIRRVDSPSYSYKREFVSSQMTMWMDSSIPLESLVVNPRARILLVLLNILGWGCWAIMIFLAFYYQFFTLHDRQFSYLSGPLLLSTILNAAMLVLAFIAIFSKKIYRTPFLMSLTAISTMIITTLCAFLVENDELFYAGTGMAGVQLVYWIAFTTGYGAVVSSWLHPFVLDIPSIEEGSKELSEAASAVL